MPAIAYMAYGGTRFNSVGDVAYLQTLAVYQTKATRQRTLV